MKLRDYLIESKNQLGKIIQRHEGDRHIIINIDNERKVITAQLIISDHTLTPQTTNIPFDVFIEYYKELIPEE